MAPGCPDYIEKLNDYLDGGIDPELCAEITEHLGKCENCRIMVDSMKQTVKLCREGKEEPLPPALEARLKGLLKKRWEEKFGKE